MSFVLVALSKSILRVIIVSCIFSKFKSKYIVFLFSLCFVVVGGVIPAHATMEDDVAQIRALLTATNGGWSTQVSNTQNIYNHLHTYLPDISSYLNSIKTSTSSIDSRIFTANGYLNTISINSSSLVANTQNIYTVASGIKSDTGNILSGLSATLPDIKDSVVQLQEVLASDEDLAIRQDQAQRVDQLNDDFLSSSGSASVSLGDLGSAKDSVSNLKSALSGGASSSQLWTVFGSSDSWSWYSQQTANDLDHTSRGLSLQSESYPLLSQYYSNVGQYLGGDYYD